MIEFKHLQQALKDYADAIRDQYKDNLERDDRRASGKLISSINTKLVVDGNEFAIELQLEDYWKWIDEGRPPTHTLTASEPPLREKILEWIKVKHIMPREYNDKLPIEKQLENMSYAITKKIHKEGYKGTYDLEDALYEVDYEHIIEEALDQDVLGCLDELVLMLS